MAWESNAISILLSLLVLWGIKLMSSPKTAVWGNRLSAFAMAAAMALILWSNGIVGVPLLWAAMAAGAVLGYILAIRATMIKMPQIVALLNGLGGGASALVALVEIIERLSGMGAFERVTSGLALAVGGATLSGSLIAAAKLDRRLSQRPVILTGHAFIATGSLIAMALLAAAMVPARGTGGFVIAAAMTVISLGYGVVFAMRVGGADMPVAISLLNALSGVAGAICGLTIGEPLLVSVGAIVGASGVILSKIMCTAMNRSLMDVLSGSTARPGKHGAPAGDAPGLAAGDSPAAPAEKEDLPVGEMIRSAAKVIIVPGYGMAIAQAQEKVKGFMDALESHGKDVRFAIHPVAGRMPGHMNVLLAEVDVPYEKLHEMQDINDDFKDTDLAVVIGACDVVNPAANTAEGTPIYGMPVLRVEEAKHVIVCNLDTKPGYSGVENSLYNLPHVHLMLGDASATLESLIAELN